MFKKYAKNCSKNETPLEATPKMANCVSTARARADRGSDPPENNKKTEKTRPENHHAQEVVLLLKSVTKLQKKGALWDDFDGQDGPGT
jgi:hypothetical protein